MNQFKRDRYDRLWPVEIDVCDECGQPDNCGDCSHGRLTDDEVLDLGGLLDTTGQFRGWDAEGHRVIVGWRNQSDGSEFLYGLTLCCGASAKGSEAGTYGIVCRSCYEDCSPSLGGEATVVKLPDGTPAVTA